MKTVGTGDVCEYDGCHNDAEGLAFSRKKDRVMKLCGYHDDLVSDEGSPEYTDVCPNCSCSNPIN